MVRVGRKTPASVAEPTALEPSPRSAQIDIRTFFEEKQPSSDVEAAAGAAYYYKYLAPARERRDAIDATALVDAFRLARRPLPAKAAYTLVNARNAGYLESSGETGSYRLNPVGFNLVEHALGKGERGPEKKNIRRKKSARRKNKSTKTRGK